jgi:hypothetical protein
MSPKIINPNPIVPNPNAIGTPKKRIKNNKNKINATVI